MLLRSVRQVFNSASPTVPDVGPRSLHKYRFSGATGCIGCGWSDKAHAVLPGISTGYCGWGCPGAAEFRNLELGRGWCRCDRSRDQITAGCRGGHYRWWNDAVCPRRTHCSATARATCACVPVNRSALGGGYRYSPFGRTGSAGWITRLKAGWDGD